MNPVLVALDLPNASDAARMARLVAPHVGGFKVGLELLMAEGPSVIDEICEMGRPVFVDAKLHDIPNTVHKSARAIAARGARWVTVHAAGGTSMIEMAAQGLDEGSGGSAGVLAVTVLTSLDDSALAETGVDGGVEAQVESLARLAAQGGAEGVICSPHEAQTVKAVSGRLLAVTPGIRPRGDSHDDQARVATPAEALESGADLLVIGRAITGAGDPASAAAAIESSILEVR